MAIYPAIWREYLGTQIKRTQYDESTLLIDGRHFIQLPYTTDGSTNPSIDTLSIFYMTKMCRALMESGDYYGVILINSTYLCRVGNMYVVITDLNNGDTLRESSILYLGDNKQLSESCAYVGFERTILLSPEVYCGYSRVLQNTKTLDIFYQNAWHPWGSKLSVCNSKAAYQEFMKTNSKVVVYSLDGSANYL